MVKQGGRLSFFPRTPELWEGFKKKKKKLVEFSTKRLTPPP